MLAVLAVIAAAESFELALLASSGCRDGWVYLDATARPLANGEFEISWSIEGDLKNDVFTERRRVENTTWKPGGKLPPHEHVEQWARRASNPRQSSEHIISCGRFLDGGRFHHHTYELDGKRIETVDGEISLDGRPLTRGTLYGVFGHKLVAHGPRDPQGFAEADIFDIRDGAHLRHVKLNLRRPLRL